MKGRSVGVLILLVSLGGYASEKPYAIRTIAGSDYSGDGGSAVSAPLRQLEGIAVDPAGNVYVADSGDNRVRRITPGGVIQSVAGDGHPGFRGDGGAAGQAQLRSPYGLALDRAGNLYIADLGNARVRRVSPDGKITTVAGGGNSDPVRGGFAVNARFNAPRNVAVDASGVLYISDFGAHRVYVVLPGGAISALAGTGTAGSKGDGGPASQAQLNAPAGLAVDADGSLYIADSGNARIRKVSGATIDTVGVAGMPASLCPLPLYAPTGVAVDAAGSLYIADGDQTLRMPAGGTPVLLPTGSRDLAVDLSGAVYISKGALVFRVTGRGLSLIAGGAPYGFFGDGGPALQARFQQPSGVAADASGNIYVADTPNHRVRKFAVGGTLTTVAGTGQRGWAGDGGPGAAARLDSPAGVVVDRSGDLYIADTGNHRVRKLSPNGLLTTIAGSGVKGFGGDGGPASLAQFDTPAGLALDAAGNLYVADAGNHRVRLVSAAGTVRTVAGIGWRGYAGDGGAALLARFDQPRGVTVDLAGNLYIADTGNNRIRRIDTAGMASTVMDGLNGPCGVAVDAGGAIYAADAGFHRIRKAAPGAEAVTIAGTAQEGFNGEEGPAPGIQLSFPNGLALDNTGNLLVTDTGNNRVRLVWREAEEAAITSWAAEVRVLHAATLQEGPFAPGSLVLVEGLTPAPDLAVSWDGVADAPLASDARGILLQVPARCAGRDATRFEIGSFARQLALLDAAPGLFRIDAARTQALAFNEDGRANLAANPAGRGSLLALAATGEGLSRLPLSITMAGVPAEVVGTGVSALSPGVLRIQVRVPQECGTGDVPVVMAVGSIRSPAGVTVAVQ